MANISSAAAQEAPHESHEAEGAAGHAATAGSLAHGGAHEGAFPPFQTENFAPQLVWLALIFGVLYILRSGVALPRVARILGNRQTRIANDLDASREMQAKAQAAAEENDLTLRRKREEAQAIGREAQQKVAADIAANRAAAEKKFADEVAAAEARIAAAKAQALGNVEGIAAEAAASIIEKLTGARVEASTLATEFRALSK